MIIRKSTLMLFLVFILVACNEDRKKEVIEPLVDVKNVFKQLDAYINFNGVYPNGYIKYTEGSDKLGEYVIENYQYRRCVYEDSLLSDTIQIIKLKKAFSETEIVNFSDNLLIGEKLFFAFNINAIDTNIVKEIGAFNISRIEYWNNHAIFYTGIWCGKNRNGYVVFLEKNNNDYKVVNVCQVWGTDPINIPK